MQVFLLDMGLSLRGGQRQVLYLARGLMAKPDGVTPVIICPAQSELCAIAKKLELPLITLPSRHDWDPRNLFILHKALRRATMGIIHTQDARSASLGALYKKIFKRCLLLHTRRVSYPLGKRWSLQKYLLADYIIAVSRDVAKTLAACGVSASKISVVHSGIEPRRYRLRQDRDDGRLVFVTVGALTAQKGFEVLLEAMALVQERKNMPPWEVRIVGKGPLFAPLFEQARMLNIQDKISFLGWQDSRQVLPNCDVMIVPSVSGEGSSAVIKEAWVVGLPAIVSDLASNRELVRHEANGLLFATGNPQALADQIVRIATEAALHTSLPIGGFESVQWFTAERMVQAYCTVYAKLLGNKPAN